MSEREIDSQPERDNDMMENLMEKVKPNLSL